MFFSIKLRPRLVAAVLAAALLVCGLVSVRAGERGPEILPEPLPEDPRPDLSAAEHVVCLTFDDGPSRYTSQLLDVLKEHGVKATFYVTGQSEEDFEMIARAHDEGHLIALHTYTHDFANYASAQAFWSDIDRLDSLIFELTGEHSRFLRFAGGSSNTVSSRYAGYNIMRELVRDCGERGISYCDWNVDTSDAVGDKKSASYISDRAVRGALEHRVSVILMHDGARASTIAEAVDEIITRLEDEGCVFATVDMLEEPVHHTMP